MAIILNDNLKINVGNPIDSKYLNSGNTAYISTSAVTTAIAVSQRYSGLTVLIQSGTTNLEYWFQNGVTDNDLIQKSPTQDQLVGEFVTGATNVGFFDGFTGVQTLPLTKTDDSLYDGVYHSIYNYYYRGTDGAIHIGTPSDGIPKRGYLRNPTIPSPVFKSWIWNEYILSSNQVGWILIDIILTSPLQNRTLLCHLQS